MRGITISDTFLESLQLLQILQGKEPVSFQAANTQACVCVNVNKQTREKEKRKI